MLAAMAAVSAPAVRAQAWPAEALRIEVPFAAGTAPDVVACMYGQKLAAQLGGTVLVENKVSGGSSIGAGYVAAEEAHAVVLKEADDVQPLCAISLEGRHEPGSVHTHAAPGVRAREGGYCAPHDPSPMRAC